ncbi:hypothetical protein I7I48_09266 [Histoplasma ohiense]|nr:hypothetical protein I7I48_09266 [Histoplasma ohiense (nom. inval.)]
MREWETRDERRDEAPHRLIRKRISVDGRESEESRSLLADVLLAARRTRWQQGQELRGVNGAMEQQRETRILTAVVLRKMRKCHYRVTFYLLRGRKYYWHSLWCR